MQERLGERQLQLLSSKAVGGGFWRLQSGWQALEACTIAAGQRGVVPPYAQAIPCPEVPSHMGSSEARSPASWDAAQMWDCLIDAPPRG